MSRRLRRLTIILTVLGFVAGFLVGYFGTEKAFGTTSEWQYTSRYLPGRVVIVDHGWTFWPTDATAPKWSQAQPPWSTTLRGPIVVAWNTAGGTDAYHTLTLRTYADYREGKWKVTSNDFTAYDRWDTPYTAHKDTMIWFNMTAANQAFWASPGNRALVLNRAIGRALGLAYPNAKPSCMTSNLTGPSVYDLQLVWTLYTQF